jgi:hypothetical protein
MEYRNHTRYDKDLLVRYNQFYLIDFLVKNFSIIAVFAVGFAVYSLIQGDWPTALMMVGFVVLYLLLTVVIQKITAASQLKKSPLVTRPFTQNYHFLDDRIHISGNREHEIKYIEILQAKVSVKHNLLLLVDVNRKTYVVDLAQFENPGDWDELKPILGPKIRKKFR